MKTQYFEDTDTLYVQLRKAEVAETRDLDEDTLIDLDDAGKTCAITFEHASRRSGVIKNALKVLEDAMCREQIESLISGKVQSDLESFIAHIQR
jgi:uncharacterized protein YuzE